MDVNLKQFLCILIYTFSIGCNTSIHKVYTQFEVHNVENYQGKGWGGDITREEKVKILLITGIVLNKGEKELHLIYLYFKFLHHSSQHAGLRAAYNRH